MKSRGDGGLATLTRMRRATMDIDPADVCFRSVAPSRAETEGAALRRSDVRHAVGVLGTPPPAPVSGGSFGCPSTVVWWDHHEHRLIHKPCGSFGCRTCGPKRTAELSARILAALRTPAWHDPYFLTLTLDPSVCTEAAADGTAEQARYGTKRVRRLFEAIDIDRKRHGLAPIKRINVYEWRDKTGAWHAHLLINVRLGVRELRARAIAAGLGKQLHLKYVKNNKRMARYIAKYVAKQSPHDGKDHRLPHYSHRYSCSRDAMPTVTLWRSARAKAKRGKLDLDAPGMIGWWTGPVGEALQRRDKPEQPDRYFMLTYPTKFTREHIARMMRAPERQRDNLERTPPAEALFF